MILRLAPALLFAACGARSGLYFGSKDAAPTEDASVDAAPDATPDAGEDAGPSGCVPAEPGCLEDEVCGNGVDDDCDARADEDCRCEPGAVQACFPGPPGNRGIGVCTDGTQTCEGTATWGPCDGAIVPREDVCNGADNLCNGCSSRRDCPILCPSPGDERVPDGSPFEDYPLRGLDFYRGPVQAWRWSVRGGPCDDIAIRLESFELRGEHARDAVFTPRLSGDYTVTLEVTTKKGTVLGCEWVVHVRGPGLRVEMCYPESTLQDLDLFLHRPGSTMQWYPDDFYDAYDPLPDSCGWHNCEATIRDVDAEGSLVPRADWGYDPSSLSECQNGPHGREWEDLGYCANPRLDIDNNLDEASGMPENINVDVPNDGESFRIMIENFTGELAHPLVNVYCGGRRVATYGAAPDEVPDFRGTQGYDGIGAMWRVADVTVDVEGEETIGCDVQALHPPGRDVGYDVTYDDPRY